MVLGEREIRVWMSSWPSDYERLGRLAAINWTWMPRVRASHRKGHVVSVCCVCGNDENGKSLARNWGRDNIHHGYCECPKFKRNKSILAVGILLRLFVDSPTHQQLDRNPLKTLPFLTLNQILLLWVVTCSSSPAHEYQAVHKVEKRLDPFFVKGSFHSAFRPPIFFPPQRFRFPVNLLSCVEY